MDQRKRGNFVPKISSKKFERMEWDPNLRERKTITDYLATALRTAIYDGQFADNEELNQVELAEFFGVSRVPIREALRQLQAEGLVQNIAHHRTIVTGMTLSQIVESIEMRAVLEAHLLRKAGKRFKQADIERLAKICEETDKIKDYGSRWVVKNWEFHRALYG
ncbi:MAG: GntR family transcriptional regulator, partial [Xanthobacteraceae bacterium]